MVAIASVCIVFLLSVSGVRANLGVSRDCVQVSHGEVCADAHEFPILLAAKAGATVQDCTDFVLFVEDMVGAHDGCSVDLSEFEGGSGKVYETCPKTCNACCGSATRGIELEDPIYMQRRLDYGSYGSYSDAVTGMCTGNTDSSEDVNCSVDETTGVNTQNKGSGQAGTDAATCCEAGTTIVQITNIVVDLSFLEGSVVLANSTELAAVADAIEKQVEASQEEDAVVIVTKVLVQKVSMVIAGFSGLNQVDQSTCVTVMCFGVCLGRDTCTCTRVAAARRMRGLTQDIYSVEATRRMRGLSQDTLEVAATDKALTGMDLPLVVEVNDLTASITSSLAEVTLNDADWSFDPIEAENTFEPENMVALEIMIVADLDVSVDSVQEPPAVADILQDMSAAIEEATGEEVSVSDLQSAVTSLDCRGSFSTCDVACKRVFSVDLPAEGDGAECNWNDDDTTEEGCAPGVDACPDNDDDNSSDGDDGSSSDDNVGIIVGCVVGVAVFLLIISVGVYFMAGQAKEDHTTGVRTINLVKAT